MLAVAMDERVGSLFLAKRPVLGSLQLLQVHDLGEHAIRPAMLSLRLLHECRILLAEALPKVPGFKAGHLRLFISHAKMDGLPLAQALKHQIDLKWLPKFYDAEDLPSGCDWQKKLEPPVKEFDAATRDDRVIDRTAIWQEFAEAGSVRLVATSDLTAEENDALLHTRVIDQVIELVLISLSRVWQNMENGS